MAKYFEAFSSNGYYAGNRGVVSDANTNGVVLAIFRNELNNEHIKVGQSFFDTRSVANWLENRMHKPGNKRRKKHIKYALEEFGGRVDIILWDGKYAEFWKQDGLWKITFFDDLTGHHRVELIMQPS